MSARVTEALRSQFKPEFLNRIDETIIFHNLTQDQIAKIVDIQIGKLQARLAEKQIELHLSEDAKALLVEKGYDPSYGARPLKRVVQRYVENELSLEILKGSIRDGDQVNGDVRDGRLVYTTLR
jgi:ATP-dependent Clp protease ATP-binding subunit ClpB